MQGDNVTLTVHNQLTQNVSLSLPGQPASAFRAGLSTAEQATGATPGGTARYAFHADRPGTFLYEAGHTENGARQVAMGLAGALVVLATDGTASGQSYDDEAVVVLSDLDPRLNADPAGFDMRRYRPRWRLLNGKPFPSTTPIATDQGHKVLLRYVDTGSVPHPMSLLGANQLVLAQDGHPVDHPVRAVVAEVDAGTTVDTIVTMPSGPDNRVTLFETGSHLDNVGQTELDPTRVATGGIMTFLDTNAPPPLDDLVGPVSSHLSVTPSVSNALAPVQVAADLSDVSTGGSNLKAAEFVLDNLDVAVGQGIAMQPAAPYSSPIAHVTGTIPVANGSCTPATGPVPVSLECLAAGKHVIYVRGEDAANNWGVVGSVVLNLPKTGPATRAGSTDPSPTNGQTAISVSATGDDSDADGVIDGAELFLDTAGANGTGLAMALNRSATVVSEDVDIPAALSGSQSCQTTPKPIVVACLAEGTHHVLVHSHDSLGLWGPVLDIPFVVDRTGPSVDAAAVSPNPSNGLLSAPGNTGYLRISALITDRDGGGALQGRLTRAEAFFAPSTATPAPGTGLALLAVDSKYDSTSENVYGLIPLSQVKVKANGTYQVYVRGRDDAGNWGPLFAMSLVVDKTAPTLGAVAASPNPTAGATQLTLTAPVTGDTQFQTAETWTGTTDPGVGKGTRVTVAYVGGNAVVTIPLAAYPLGSTRFNLRVQDLAGNWSNAVNTTVTISAPVGALLSDNFDGGNLSHWSSTTGGPTVSTTAGLFPTDGTNRGMQTTLPGTRYATDNSPSAETVYHARFAFSGAAMGIPSGATTAVTVFDGRTATGSAFTVQVGRLAAGRGPVTRVRIVMSRSGAGAVTGTWVNVSNAPHVLQVDWLSGPATGSGQGSLRLSVDGTAVSTLTGNTSTLRVESVRLGTSAGVAAGSTGAAYFDSFVSSRAVLP
jgi:hypothetical protein